jgi:hypothetical protein
MGHKLAASGLLWCYGPAWMLVWDRGAGEDGRDEMWNITMNVGWGESDRGLCGSACA